MRTSYHNLPCLIILLQALMRNAHGVIALLRPPGISLSIVRVGMISLNFSLLEWYNHPWYNPTNGTRAHEQQNIKSVPLSAIYILNEWPSARALYGNRRHMERQTHSGVYFIEYHI